MEKNIVNKIPALTWNWLKMNYGVAELPSEIKNAVPSPNSDGSSLHFEISGGASSFENKISTKDGEEKVVFMDYTSKDAACENAFFSVKTDVELAENSKLHLVKIQLLGKNTTHIDKTNVKLAENSRFTFTQVELGGNRVFAEMNAELSGNRSSIKTDTAYSTKEAQDFDINYVATHTGKETECEMNVKGVMDGDSKKVYRGTIDFKNGCSGAKGNEMEETLLLSPTVVNKSIPIILCDEEDVEGEHGATIGRLSQEELFYMQSRGISETEAKIMMSKARVLSVAALSENEELVNKVKTFLGESEE